MNGDSRFSHSALIDSAGGKVKNQPTTGRVQHYVISKHGGQRFIVQVILLLLFSLACGRTLWGGVCGLFTHKIITFWEPCDLPLFSINNGAIRQAPNRRNLHPQKQRQTNRDLPTILCHLDPKSSAQGNRT
jgi:hypothetical protein